MAKRVKNLVDTRFFTSELCAMRRPKAPPTASEKPLPGFLLALPLLRTAWPETLTCDSDYLNKTHKRIQLKIARLRTCRHGSLVLPQTPMSHALQKGRKGSCLFPAWALNIPYFIFLLSGIGPAYITCPGDIIEAAIVELCQLYQSVHRNAHSAGFIITVSALRYCKYFRNAFLGKRSFLPQSTKSFCVTHM